MAGTPVQEPSPSEGIVAPLDATTAACLRSGVVTPSLPIALMELVMNGLDARATRIDIEVDSDPSSPLIRVSDNGRGVDNAALRLLGRFRYGTSRRSLKPSASSL